MLKSILISLLTVPCIALAQNVGVGTAMTDYPMYENCVAQWAIDANGSCGNDR